MGSEHARAKAPSRRVRHVSPSPINSIIISAFMVQFPGNVATIQYIMKLEQIRPIF